MHMNTQKRTNYAGPASGMFEVFGQTGPPILGGPPLWTLKNFHITYSTLASELIVFHTLRYRRLRSALFLLEGI